MSSNRHLTVGNKKMFIKRKFRKLIFCVALFFSLRPTMTVINFFFRGFNGYDPRPRNFLQVELRHFLCRRFGGKKNWESLSLNFWLTEQKVQNSFFPQWRILVSGGWAKRYFMSPSPSCTVGSTLTRKRLLSFWEIRPRPAPPWSLHFVNTNYHLLCEPWCLGFISWALSSSSL